MPQMDTDYLVIGAGACGLAFADTLAQHSDAHITLVDRHALPGGHWNDAYPFVALHQPSAFYGVNSLELGSGRKDTLGHNSGMYELATGAEVCGYFQRVMHQRLLPSGRVRHLPMNDFRGIADGTARVESMLTGAVTDIQVRRRLVDATWFSPDVPATTAPKYRVEDGVRLVTPTGLTQLWQGGAGQPPQPGHRGHRGHLSPPGRYAILGAGKTAMDVGVWLLQAGVDAGRISWVMPRDSWVVNRLGTQPGEEFFEHSIGGQVQQMKALAEAGSVEDLFERLEAAGQMLRLDRSQTPRMFHYATLAVTEVQMLRQIGHVIRQGRVQAVEREALVLDHGRQTMPADTLYIDCTASAVRYRPAQPVFQPGRLVPQLLRAPLVTFSAAVCAYVEAMPLDDAEKNALCTPVPFPSGPAGYIASTLVSMANQMRWSQHKPLRQWMRDSRLDGFGKMVSNVAPDDTAKLALLAELRQQAKAALDNAPRLMAAAVATVRG